MYNQNLTEFPPSEGLDLLHRAARYAASEGFDSRAYLTITEQVHRLVVG